jgi:hypothetical protein
VGDDVPEVWFTGSYEWLRLLRRADLKPTTKLVAFDLASYANPDGKRVRPGEERVARDLDLTERAVRTHMAILRDLGMLTRIKGHGRGHRADEYWLSWPFDTARVPMRQAPDGGPADDDGPFGDPDENRNGDAGSNQATPDMNRNAASGEPDNGEQRNRHARSGSTDPSGEVNRNAGTGSPSGGPAVNRKPRTASQREAIGLNRNPHAHEPEPPRTETGTPVPPTYQTYQDHTNSSPPQASTPLAPPAAPAPPHSPGRLAFAAARRGAPIQTEGAP